MSSDQERMETGLEIRKRVLGAERVEKTMASVDDFNREWQDYVNRACWGETWARTGISSRTRSLITLAILATLGKDNELQSHTRGALTNGCTLEEIQDTLFHVAVYAGVPAAFAAFRSASAVVKETLGGD